jgi:hypothetical protein
MKKLDYKKRKGSVAAAAARRSSGRDDEVDQGSNNAILAAYGGMIGALNDLTLASLVQ